MRQHKWNSRIILWPCKDCGQDIQPVRKGKRYTWKVKDHVWKEAGMKPGELLCSDCFLKRLGRDLELRDLLYMTTGKVSRKQWRNEVKNVRATGNVWGITVGSNPVSFRRLIGAGL